MAILTQLKSGVSWRLAVCRERLAESLKRGLLARIGPFACNVCGRRTWKFDPLPAHYLDMNKKHGRVLSLLHGETCNINSYQCPTCQAPDRVRLYALFLSDWFGDQLVGPQKIFVDFAPSRSLTRYVRDEIAGRVIPIKYVTADLAMKDVDFSVDISNMPVFADQSVDFFICSHVLEHVHDDRKAMAELYRILKPGGAGILMVPIDLKLANIDEGPDVTDVAERWRRFGQNDHVRMYNKQGFLDRVQAAGFVVRQYGIRHFGRLKYWRTGLALTSVLYVVEKPR